MFKQTGNFVQLPMALITYYSHFPKFNGNCVAVYAFLMSRYNDQYGYAFPTIVQIAQALDMSDSTVRKAIKTLESAGLIEVIKRKGFANNSYVPLEPLNESDFYRAFPEASARRTEADAIWASITERRHSDKDVIVANVGESQTEDIQW